MKTTFKLIITALAVASSFASCTKEVLTEKANPDSPVEGLRTIAVSFETSTKTYLDGLKPRFCAGDSILFFSDAERDTCKVFEIEGRAFVKTKIQGEIQGGVYPYYAAVFEEGTENKLKQQQVMVPSAQDGSFKKANICVNSGVRNNTASFKHLYVAILKFYADESIGVKKISIGYQDGTSASDTTAFAFNNQGAPVASITVEVPETTEEKETTEEDGPASSAEVVYPQDSRILYATLYVQSPLKTENLQFVIETEHQGNKTVILKQTSSINALGMYSIFVPYYVKVNVGTPEAPEYQKWSYCNLGAFIPEEPGHYFSWGNIKGYGEKSDYGKKSEPCFTFTDEQYKNDSLNEIKDGDGFLENNDAAHSQLGGKWRMPTKEELEKLLKKASLTDKGLKIDNLLLPFTGIINENELSDDDYGYYWSNKLPDSGGDISAYALKFHESGQSVSTAKRYMGCTIRPIYDETINIGPFGPFVAGGEF